MAAALSGAIAAAQGPHVPIATAVAKADLARDAVIGAGYLNTSKEQKCHRDAYAYSSLLWAWAELVDKGLLGSADTDVDPQPTAAVGVLRAVDLTILRGGSGWAVRARPLILAAEKALVLVDGDLGSGGGSSNVTVECGAGGGVADQLPLKRRRLADEVTESVQVAIKRLPNTETERVEHQTKSPHFASAIAAKSTATVIPRVDAASLSSSKFREMYLETGRPVVITGAAADWPAMGSLGSTSNGRHGWADFAAIASSKAGVRLVPVEVYDAEDASQTYLTASWHREVMTLADYINKFVLRDTDDQSDDNESDQSDGDSDGDDATNLGSVERRGYLAQYGLFHQIPSLQDDIKVPAYCHELLASDRVPAVEDESGGGVDDMPADSSGVRTSAWLGPKGTVSPLHYDPYHNILTQVAGFKFIRIVSPNHSAKLYPRAAPRHNNSAVNLDDVDHELFPLFKDAPSQVCVLGPGDMLYIPRHWWHYVRSLSPSFSVNFFWGARL
jgi:hypothetical protein